MFPFLYSTGYPAFYFPSPFVGFYPPMGMTTMPYPSFYPPQFMSGYFPPSHSYPGYIPHPSSTPYPTADRPSHAPRRSQLTEGPLKNQERGATEVNDGLKESKPSRSSRTDITESRMTEEGVDGQFFNQKDRERKQETTADGKGSRTDGTRKNVVETGAISEVTIDTF